MFIRALAIWLVVFTSICAAQTRTPPPEVGIDEHLGGYVPKDLVFLDEDGQPVRLGDMMDTPIILSLVYYRCPGICSPLLSGVVDVLEKMDLKPGKDYRVLTISFDPTETPDLAKHKKKNYFKAFTKPFPEDAWRFMTGSEDSVKQITEAVGFRYKKEGKDFVHAATLVFLGTDGKISRYLSGITFLPFDVKMAVYEASHGRVGPTVNRVLLYCFSYDPEGKTYVFNLLKVTGTVTMLFALAFVLFLVITGRKRKKEN